MTSRAKQTVRMRLWVPLPPNLANSRMHWRSRQRQWRQYQALAMPFVVNAKHQLGGPWPIKHATVRARLLVHNTMDDDNAVARLKWVLDVLKHHRIIRDDKRPHMKLGGIPTQVIERSAPGVEIIITGHR